MDEYNGLDTAEERIREFKSRRKYPNWNTERQKEEEREKHIALGNRFKM